MAVLLIGVYANGELADNATDELLALGCAKDDIRFFGGPKGNPSDEEDVIEELRERAMEADEARRYAAAVKDGKTLLLADTPDEVADDARHAIEAYEADDRAAAEEEESGEEESGEEEEQEGEEGATSLPVAEEEVRVGARSASSGVEARRIVSEQPVEEIVHLRREAVEVERKPVDRALRPEEQAHAFEEMTVEMTETSEEPVVEKEARVIEEVSLRKNVEERDETVRDTARKSDVEVRRTPRRES